MPECDHIDMNSIAPNLTETLQQQDIVKIIPELIQSEAVEPISSTTIEGKRGTKILSKISQSGNNNMFVDLEN